MFKTITEAFDVYKAKLQEFAKMYVENADDKDRIPSNFVIRSDWFKFMKLQAEVMAMGEVLGIDKTEFEKLFTDAKKAARKI